MTTALIVKHIAYIAMIVATTAVATRAYYIHFGIGGFRN